MKLAMFAEIEPTEEERAAAMPGDDLVSAADAVMDRGFTLPAPADQVWPWIVQLGKTRAGWYLPRRLESVIPPARRASRALLPQWQHLAPGDVIPDYGGPHESFQVVSVDAPTVLVYRSQRGGAQVSWAITLTQPSPTTCRIHLRLRIGPVKRKWLVNSGGELIDLLTVAGLAAGLRERLLAE